MVSTEHSARRRVLVVDDDTENREFITEALRMENYETEAAASGPEALQKIDTWNPELVLLDYNMPGASGLETLKRLRQHHNYVATIFISANSEQELVNDCLDAGADDYVRKPFNFGELLARIKVRFRNKDVQDALTAANLRLKELSERDDVTGLYNMRSIYEKIEHEMKRARRYSHRVAIIMMDLDFFKQVNDNFDHIFGSFYLSQVGKIIKDNMREIDFAARYGGDEFLMVLTQASEEGALNFAERVRTLVGKFVCREGENTFSRTASLGIAVSPVGSDMPAKELVRRADHALYKSKENGRNRVTIFAEPATAPLKKAG